MKEVANTLTSVLEAPLMRQILDRSLDITPVIQQVSDFWGMDLYTRKPGPAYRDGVFVGTDLDLACFLYALIDRRAVIKIPTYENLRAKTHTEGQALSSRHNRHGQILALVSNKETFVFSVKIKDMNVMTTDAVGDYRNFALTDFDGDWYEGWRVMEFLPTAAENKFITESKLWTDNKIIFKNFVHPMRWTSFFGQYYLITKALVARLQEETLHIKAVIQDMEKNGVTRASAQKRLDVYESRKTTKVEAGQKVTVQAFEVEVDLPQSIAGYASPVVYDTKNLLALDQRVVDYRRAVASLQFMTRATELAYVKQCMMHPDKDENLFPAWIKNAHWEREYTQQGKRKKWDRLVLFQPAVGQLGVALRKRTWTKSEEVSESYSD